MIVALVAVGALVGAPLRYVTDRAVQSWHETALPWGTWTVNAAACFVLGVVTGGFADRPHVVALVGTGFCGALSTYSTFGYEEMRLSRRGRRGLAAGYVALSVLGGLALAALGWWLAALF